MKKFVSALLTVFTLLTILPFTLLDASAYESSYQGWEGDLTLSGVEDDFGVFSSHPEMIEVLNEDIRECAKNLKLNICVFLAGPTHRMSDGQTPDFCGDEYDKRFGEDTDGVYFFVDMSGKTPAYDYLLTSGKAILYYNGRTNAIRESTYAYFPSSDEANYAEHYVDIAKGIERFLDSLEKYKDTSTFIDKVFYDPNTGKYVYYKGGNLVVTDKKPLIEHLRWIPLSLLGGLIMYLIFYFSIKGKYKFKSKTNPRIYVAENQTSYQRKDDIFIRSRTSKTRLSSQSSGGGHSGGGGGHHSGGTHGGSGGHR